jgi:hypothetical protein
VEVPRGDGAEVSDVYMSVDGDEYTYVGRAFDPMVPSNPFIFSCDRELIGKCVEIKVLGNGDIDLDDAEPVTYTVSDKASITLTDDHDH